MPYRLIPVALIIVIVLLFTLGEMQDDDGGRASDDFNWNSAITGVDSVLDDALTKDSFDFIHDSVTGTARNVGNGVDDFSQ